jgi:hypothetical protein
VPLQTIIIAIIWGSYGRPYQTSIIYLYGSLYLSIIMGWCGRPHQSNIGLYGGLYLAIIMGWYGVPHTAISFSLSSMLLFLYINDLSKTINRKSKPILFADDTSVIFTKSKSEDFKNDINIVFESVNKWLEAIKLSLNFDKTHYI